MGSLRTRAISDAGVFLNTRDFGQQATFTAVGASAKVINVNLIASWAPSELFEGSVENADAAAMVKLSDVTGAKPGSTLTLGAVTYYTIATPQDSGHGMAMLMLSLDEP